MNFEKINSIDFESIYCIKDTFPEITLSRLPQDVLMMLKRSYSGNKSELTSINQYMYQSFVIWSNPKLSNLSHNMEQIAIREMQHYKMLAKILVKCGIDPKNCVYIDGNLNLCDYWKASSISYEKTLVSIFEKNILLEERAINEYKQIIDKTDNENLKQILLRIVQDEESHIMFFRTVLQELKN